MPVTIYDIAKAVGTSTSTVSRVLNGRGSALVSQATRERILNAAEEMGYRPNALARALVTGRTGNLGLFVQALRERTDPQFPQMLEAVELKAHSLGCRLLLSGDLESLADGGRVDGTIVLDRPSRARQALALAPAPVMYVHPEPEGQACSVCWSDSEGAYQAVRHLLALGHRRIAGLFAEYADTDPPPGKVAGFRRAIWETGAVGHEWRGVLSADAFENAYLLTRRRLCEHPEITAIFARNDILALGAMRAAREAGRSVPGDLSIVGYSDTLLAHCAQPGLTSVRTPIARAGEIAVEQVMRALAQRDAAFPQVVLPTTLTVRESSGRLR